MRFLRKGVTNVVRVLLQLGAGRPEEGAAAAGRGSAGAEAPIAADLPVDAESLCLPRSRCPSDSHSHIRQVPPAAAALPNHHSGQGANVAGHKEEVVTVGPLKVVAASLVEEVRPGGAPGAIQGDPDVPVGPGSRLVSSPHNQRVAGLLAAARVRGRQLQLPVPVNPLVSHEEGGHVLVLVALHGNTCQQPASAARLPHHQLPGAPNPDVQVAECVAVAVAPLKVVAVVVQVVPGCHSQLPDQLHVDVAIGACQVHIGGVHNHGVRGRLGGGEHLHAAISLHPAVEGKHLRGSSRPCGGQLQGGQLPAATALLLHSDTANVADVTNKLQHKRVCVPCLKVVAPVVEPKPAAARRGCGPVQRDKHVAIGSRQALVSRLDDEGVVGHSKGDLRSREGQVLLIVRAGLQPGVHVEPGREVGGTAVDLHPLRSPARARHRAARPGEHHLHVAAAGQVPVAQGVGVQASPLQVIVARRVQQVLAGVGLPAVCAQLQEDVGIGAGIGNVLGLDVHHQVR
mmetsp:Transcript_38224/g.108025  ORF Transcript_38224/g.108025 Transcript_38224/m.108025 type:complete len:513 (-) Transcript_38224:1515-3053(-)